MTEKIFGEKERFAIEIKHHIKNKYFIRFWFNKTIIGKFRNADKLDRFIVHCEWFQLNYTNLWEEKFSQMSDVEIEKNLVNDGFKLNGEELNLFIKRSNDYNFNQFGSQFRIYTMTVLFDKNFNCFKFLIYEMDGKTQPKLHSFKVDREYFLEVYKDFFEFMHLQN